jgi:aminobenzoyl-glutamate transport protein
MDRPAEPRPEDHVSADVTAPRPTGMARFLDGIERLGNKVPNPTILFLYLIVLIAVLSAILAWAGVSASEETVVPDKSQQLLSELNEHLGGNYSLYDSTTGEPATTPHYVVETTEFPVRNLLSVGGLRFFFESFVDNFAGFGVVAVVLISMGGVGVAEQAGMMGAMIRRIVTVAPARALTFILVLVGVLSSVATDAGYLILVPLAAAAFASVGRHPLAGMSAAFAAVGAVFGVNLLITPSDSMLTEITNDVLAGIGQPSLNVTQNFYFSIVSSIVLAAVVTFFTTRFVEPRLGAYDPAEAGENVAPAEEVDPAAEKRGLRFAGWTLLGVVVVLLALTLPPGAPLRDPETGDIIGTTPFMASLIFVISLAFLLCGIAYGRGAGTLKGGNAIVGAVTKTWGSLAGLLVMFLMIAQFIALFNWSNIPTVAAIKAAQLLEHASVPAIVLLVVFIIVIVVLDIILPGLIPKWAIFAPVFLPIFATLGIAPQTLLAAYRVGDSPVNVITPLMVYLPFIVTVAQRYVKKAGLGTIISLMLPYTVVVLVSWLVLFIAWFYLGIPWGPDAPVHLPS